MRNEIRIPDLKGYRTLKCDFHIHTVFSDGTVWPTVRVEEAYREGLDAIVPHGRHTIKVTLLNGATEGDVNFEITNLWIEPGKGLPYRFGI